MKPVPIEEHGLIGDLRTAALVSREGEIDWLCLPDFDSPSVFASLLDREKGGRFRVAPLSSRARGQSYERDTAILHTFFQGKDYEAELIDFMPPREILRSKGSPEQAIFRIFLCQKGGCEVEAVFSPCMDYARLSPLLKREGNQIAAEGGDIRLMLNSEFPLEVNGAIAKGKRKVLEGESFWFCLQVCPSGPANEFWGNPRRVGHSFYEGTRKFWTGWIKRSSYRGNYQEAVQRSLITLKLLTHQKTGAIVAAPTMSLPSILGGERNWDYRYTWLRDAAFSLVVFLRCGFVEEAEAFFNWLKRLLKRRAGGLSPVYSVRGDELQEEEVLGHLSGYKNSRPVRVGNAAGRQFQLDLYGEVIDAFYQFAQVKPKIAKEIWMELHQLVEELYECWKKPDVGIWELRSEPLHLVHSKVMAWVGFDRAITLLDPLGRGPGLFRSLKEGIRETLTKGPSKLKRWQEAKEEIKERILKSGWNQDRGTFARAFGEGVLDASVLTMSSARFISPLDPRIHKTRHLIQKELSRDGLLLRYAANDGLPGEESPFLLCSFWLVQNLLCTGDKDEGTQLFEHLLGLGNEVDLYSEGMDSASRSFLGNFPQAYTHLGLIQCALELNEDQNT